MYNVKHYLNTVQKDKLIDAYYDMIKDDIIFSKKNINISVNNLENMYREKITKFIEKLSNMEITKSDNNLQGIILAYNSYDTDILVPDIVTSLIYEDDLRENKFKVETYAYEFLPQSTIIGFLISDSKFTQDNIYEILANILYEASFFGFNEESKQKVKDELNEAIEEINSFESKSSLVSFEDAKKDLGIIEEKNDEKETEFKNNIMNMTREINIYLYEKELKEVMNCLNIN